VRLPRLYAILDAELAESRGWSPLDLGRAFFNGGARLVQLRAKHWPSGLLLDAAARLVEMARDFGAAVIVNDRADVALLAGANGVHLGQDDLSPADARRLVGPDAAVGLSTHTPAQVDLARLDPVTYLAIGPIWTTATKDTGYDAVGLDLIRYAAGASKRGGGVLPVVAIGGVTLARAPEAISAGAASVAVIGDLLATGDPEARTREYVMRLEER
jgi:thiamine-phosphate pyrophosphorylase